jgi:hypothetical protein
LLFVEPSRKILRGTPTQPMSNVTGISPCHLDHRSRDRKARLAPLGNGTYIEAILKQAGVDFSVRR